MSDTDSDVYRFEVWFIFAYYEYVCLFPTDVTGIQDTVFVHLHAYINAEYVLQLRSVIIANDHANIRPIRTGIKRVDWPITEHARWSTLTIRHNV